MKKLFTVLAVAMCSTLAMAQTNQYFWAGGQFIMGNPINQIDSITFGQLEQTDSVLLYLPHTIKVVHDTIIQYVTIHDTINPCAIPDGAISGKFSVSPTKQVYFSQGNLQYIATQGTHICADGTTKQGTWRFAENQYDRIGYTNTNKSKTYDGWIDLFAWGTSGYCNKFPYMTSTTSSDYGFGDDKDIKGTYFDWGLYVPISNSDNIAGTWYTMDSLEWIYLCNDRSNAINLYGIACVNQVNGVIFLPDNWQCPNGISFQSGYATNEGELYFAAHNQYSAQEWKILEQSGAVFLPTSGCYIPQTPRWREFNVVGTYWTSNYASNLRFTSKSMNSYFYWHDPADWVSVRLVQDVK